MKKILRCLERWRHYLLAMLCAAVMLLSALWTREMWAAETPDSLALSDHSQRLSDVTPTSAPLELTRPVDGPVRVPYSEAPVFDPRAGVWRVHPYVEFAAEPGLAVRALLPGVVLSVEGEVAVDHGEGTVSRYRGLETVSVRPGQTLPAGGVLGTAAEGGLRVWLIRDGAAVSFGNEWLDNSPKTSYNSANDQITERF